VHTINISESKGKSKNRSGKTEKTKRFLTEFEANTWFFSCFSSKHAHFSRVLLQTDPNTPNFVRKPCRSYNKLAKGTPEARELTDEDLLGLMPVNTI